MKTISLVSLLTILTGCSSSIPVGAGSPPNELTYAEMNRRISERHAAIVMTNGDSVEVLHAQTTSDSTIWVDPLTRKQFWVKTARVREIIWIDGWGGGLEGFVAGSLVGGAAGLGVGAATQRGDNASIGVGGMTFTGAIAGAVAGCIYGAIRGHTYQYQIASDSTAANTKEPIEFQVK